MTISVNNSEGMIFKIGDKVKFKLNTNLILNEELLNAIFTLEKLTPTKYYTQVWLSISNGTIIGWTEIDNLELVTTPCKLFKGFRKIRNV